MSPGRISPQTAELALDCLQIVYRQYRATNGGSRPLPDKWRTAWGELAAAVGTVADDGNGDGEAEPRPEMLTVAEMAARDGTPARTVRWRCQTGVLPARRVGRQWLIEIAPEPKEAA